MSVCKFDIAWVGECGEVIDDTHAFCKKHRKLRCVVCNKQAIMTCDTTMGPLVCGAPLCSDERCNDIHGEKGHPF